MTYGIDPKPRFSFGAQAVPRGARCGRFARRGGNPGTYEVRWDGKDNQGRPAPSGIYFVNVEQGFMHSTTRLVLAR